MTKVYVLGSRGHIGRYKIGISKRQLSSRTREVSKAIKSDAYVVFACPLIFAYVWEQLLHIVYKPLNANMGKGDGHSEWFWLIAPITPILFICFFFCLEMVAIVTVSFAVNNYFNPPQKQVQTVEKNQTLTKRVKHRTQ